MSMHHFLQVHANLTKSRDNSQKSEIAPKLDTSKSDVKKGKNTVHFEKVRE